MQESSRGMEKKILFSFFFLFHKVLRL
uniref:Uncharacterized protein n=1 Tax=Anguilla anguilla TaxID=7936 RepID=A0A0E9W8J6_ANGAN